MKTNNLKQKRLALNSVKSNKGFSLIELLVVIGIIGILAAVAIPAYRGYQDDAKRGVTDSIIQTAYRTIQINQASGKETTVADLKTKVTSKGKGVTFVINPIPILGDTKKYCFSVEATADNSRPAGCGEVYNSGAFHLRSQSKGVSSPLICRPHASTSTSQGSCKK